MNILEEVSFGTFTIEVALILRQSLFLSSLLNNSESWYNVRKTEIDIMESADEKLLRKILEAPIKTPKCMLYLETGTLPIRFILISRRMMFLHYILNEGEKSILSRFSPASLLHSVLVLIWLLSRTKKKFNPKWNMFIGL